METSLLQTKLYIPPARPGLVPRPRLLARLNASVRSNKLTLISAPAGFGKTTLLSEWVASLRSVRRRGVVPPAGAMTADTSSVPLQVAWLSLDESDNDPNRFLAYVVAALQAGLHAAQQTVEAEIGKGVLAALQSPQPPPAEAVLTALINEIVALSDRIVLVLDDYHLVEAQPIHDAITFLLRHLPPAAGPFGGLHLVIATRDDPLLPLARLRARGQLTELRATDFRFTPSEAAEFLNRAMGLDLSAQEIAALETRTEGWIAGLQLAALALQGSLASQGTQQRHKDASSFIDSFTGSHRFVLDYLIEEVLEQQPASVQAFLQQTAVLNRLTGPLCDAVTDRALTGQVDGRETLEMLERANLFIVPLDGERRWYRYHHLFADLLRQRLHQTQPGQVPTLHRRAGAWYEERGLMAEALHHIFAAGEFQWAGRTLEQIGTETIWKRGDWSSFLQWLERLPQEVLHSQPKLCLLSAWAMHISGRSEAIEPLLRSVESFVQDAGAGADVQSLVAELTTIRAYTTRWRGDLPRAVELLNRALGLLPGEEVHIRALAIGGLAAIHYLRGEIKAASPLFGEAREMSLVSGHLHIASVNTTRLAEVQMLQGHLHQAADTYRQLQQQLARQGKGQASAAGHACVGLGELLREWNDLDGAVQQFREGIERGVQMANPRILLLGYVGLARALQAQGDAAGARGAMQEAEQAWEQYHVTRWWGVPPVAAYQARLCLEQGELAHATRWAQQEGLNADDELSYQREVEYITLARVLIAQGNADDAAGLLRRLLEPAQAGGRTSRAIEILVLAALVFQAQGDTGQAIAALAQALTLAEPEGFCRLFVDEGAPMARLLYKAISRGVKPDYAGTLLAAFPDHKAAPVAKPRISVRPAVGTELVEPLSERELEVLQLIAEGLTNPEIGSRLYLSTNTVKAHTRNIYGKLGVHNRTQAVARARALRILFSTT